MKKRTICFILAVLMIATLLPTQVFAASSGKWGDNISWNLSDGTLTISGKGAMDEPGEDPPPWYGLEGIEKIVVKDGVTTIPDLIFMGGITEDGYIFGTATAKSISIPASVKSIGDYALFYTFMLEKITVSSSNKYYSNDTQGILYNKDKTALVWLPGYKTGTVKIPKTVQTVWTASLDLAMGVEKYVVDAANAKFKSDDQGAIYYKESGELLMVPRAFSGTFVIPEGTPGFWNTAFMGCYNLERVKIPEGITEIPPESFYGCANLKDIWLPASLETVGENAFAECSWMINAFYYGSRSDWGKINIEDGNEWLKQCDFIYYGCDHEETHRLHSATCTEAEQIQCDICEKVFDGQPALGHTEETIPGKPATCLEDGMTDGTKCSVCNEVLAKQEVIPATGHQGEWNIIKEATETEKGIKERTCTVCGEKETVEYELYDLGDVNKDGHINALDATQILRHANGKTSVMAEMTEAEKLGIADVNKDGYVNALDATQILRFANGKSSVLK